MDSTLAIRSQASAQHNFYAPYNPTSEASRLRSSVAEARSHRPTNESDCWQTPQTAATYNAGTKVYNPYAIRDKTFPSVNATAQYDGSPPADSHLPPPPPQDVAHPGNFNLAFSPPPTTGQPIVETDQYHYLGPSSTPCAPCYQPECNSLFSRPSSQSHVSQPSSALSFTGAPLPMSTAAYAYIEPAQSPLYPPTYPVPESNPPVEGPADMLQSNHGYRSNSTTTQSRPVSEGFTHPGLTNSSRPQSSYNSEHYILPSYIAHNERRGSIASSVSPDDTFAYQVNDGQGDGYGPLSGYSQAQHTAYPPATPTTLPSGDYAQPPSMALPLHIAAGSPHTDPPAPTDRELSQPAPRSAASSPMAPEIGPPKSVQRRLGIMMNAQRKHAEQVEGINQLPKRASKKLATVDNRRDKRSQSIDVSDCDSKSTTASKPKSRDSASRYKVAYERVRLQRNFFEGATASLLHQVRMLGGDPMQASDRASKGEDLDPKKARLLVASLQQDLEASREKVIEIQTEATP
ncbi:hypothetical protein FRC09_006626 [Ceratobasidium sp. 395]|nr:hypothetical protein FRC09_006626 [Ceratobasidium sp. 395]